MDLASIGERETVASIVDAIKHSQEGMSGDALGLEDDCAAIPSGDGYLLLSTDTVSARTHFPFGTPMELAGWYAAAVNISDLAAMGAEPVGLLMAYGLPLETTPEEVADLTGGVLRCAMEYGVPLLGGDTKRNESLTVTGTAVGLSTGAGPMPRRAVDGLEDGDAVVVTGTLGAAAAGCLVTYRLKGSGDQLRERKRYIEALGHVLEVRPRLAEGRALAGTGLVRCAMDLSDGLARSLHTLGGLNDCGFALTAGDLPAAKYAGATATGEGVSIEELTLYYGGDFELVAVLGGGADGVAAAAKAVEAAGGTLTVVGRVVAGGEFALEGPEGAAELEDRGWEHFFSS